MIPVRVAALGLVAWLPLACAADRPNPDGTNDDIAGGQTGSASCGPEPDCVCDVATRAVLARAQVVEASPLDVELSVTDVFTANARVTSGQLLQGSYQLGFPCGLGVEATIEPGSDVLLAVDLGSLYLVPWQPELTLARGLTLPSNDVELLLDEPTCRSYFTSATPQECASDQ